MTEQRNLILAIILSVGIILAFQLFYEAPRMREAQEKQAIEQSEHADATLPQPAGATSAASGPSLGNVGGSAGLMPRDEALATEPRVAIDNGRLHGSIALEGLRIDDVTLVDYRESVDPTSPEIKLLNPAGAAQTYFAEFGWVPDDKNVAVPDSNAVWQASGDRLAVGSPVVLTWDNGAGLVFRKTISVDENFLFSIAREVVNESGEPVTLYPYSLISRWGTPQTMGYYILHEGPIGVFDETLNEIDYDDLLEDGDVELTSKGGWIGFTDKYWLTALVPDQTSDMTANFRHINVNGQDRYQVDYLGQGMVIAPGSSIEVTDHFFAGAKEVDKLDHYSETYNVPLFDRAVDFGWFYFLTKPFFYILNYFYVLVGNYGIAILMLTLLVKIVFFPLANKSYKAMSQMKKLQPKMQELREKHSDDRQRMQQELMQLYKREKVNPMSGCLPIIVQIPVFFSLYKVLFVSIEMRHAPFFGWIKDLSAPDPTTLFNLFGLLPFTPPQMLMIGVWPLLMGLTMFLQQRLNPQPADPIQAKVMTFLPLMFVFLFATFPAGLVIYWTWNNILSISQQWIIMRRMGVKAG